MFDPHKFTALKLPLTDDGEPNYDSERYYVKGIRGKLDIDPAFRLKTGERFLNRIFYLYRLVR